MTNENHANELHLLSKYLSLINEKHDLNERSDEINDELDIIKAKLNKTKYFKLNEDSATIEILDYMKDNDDDDEEDDDDNDNPTKIPRIVMSRKSIKRTILK